MGKTALGNHRYC